MRLAEGHIKGKNNQKQNQQTKEEHICIYICSPLPHSLHRTAVCSLASFNVAVMPGMKVCKKRKDPSFARLSPLAKGRVIGLREAGHDRADGAGTGAGTGSGTGTMLHLDMQVTCRSQAGHRQVTGRSQAGHGKQ